MAKVITKQKSKGLRQQILELLAKRTKKKDKNWAGFFGKVQFDIDPVEYQRNLRDD